ncbi:hypothetical protein HDU82_001617 [Entophlyctis luteolus]|nr:hypothetical protein HDU82_001617 [Entophlyctis luteolus]
MLGLRQPPTLLLLLLLLLFLLLPPLLVLSLVLLRPHAPALMLSPHAASPDLAAIYAALNDAAAAELVSVPLRFEGHQVWRVAIRSQTDLDRIFTLQEQVPTLDYWTDPRIDSHGVDIRVSSAKGAQDALSDYLNSNRNPPVENSHGQQSFLTDTADPIKSYFTKYHTTSEINSYLSYLATTYPDIVEMFSIGETYEGRNQWGVKIRSPKTHLDAQKKEFVFFGGHHAREWIGPAVVQYIMTELIVKYGENEEITTALDDFDFTIIPVLNVDGYEYTHPTNRMVLFFGGAGAGERGGVLGGVSN